MSIASAARVRIIAAGVFAVAVLAATAAWAAAPTVTAISPSMGTTAGGTSVTSTAPGYLLPFGNVFSA